jgi:hypothetical protein
VSVTLCQRLIQRRGTELLGAPTHALQIGSGPGRREIGDSGQMHPRSPSYLRQVHGGEFSGTDQAYAQGFAIRLALLQLVIQIHSFSSQ